MNSHFSVFTSLARLNCLVLFVTFGFSAYSQPLQREWVRTYASNLSITNGASTIAHGPDGNVVVAGTSQNTEGDLDYELIKYKPNGDEAWRVRYGAPMQHNDHLRGMTIDPLGNIIVTGTSDT